jgi:hypothetical protein
MKRGSIEISFGMIFSIIIIITLIGVAVYGISIFLDVGSSTEAGLFYDEFEGKINEIWSSSTTNRVVSFTLPSKIKFVCFGSMTASDGGRYNLQLQELKMASNSFEQQNTNTFLYPATESKDLAFRKVDKIDLSSLSQFDCFEVKNRKVDIRLSKGEFDSLVKIQHA